MRVPIRVTSLEVLRRLYMLTEKGNGVHLASKTIHYGDNAVLLVNIDDHMAAMSVACFVDALPQS